MARVSKSVFTVSVGTVSMVGILPETVSGMFARWFGPSQLLVRRKTYAVRPDSLKHVPQAR